MKETELLEQILNELKKVNSTIIDLKATIEANQELLMNKLGVLEAIADKSRNFLESIGSNSKF